MDSRAINKITINYRFSTLWLDDVLDIMIRPTVVLKIDLSSGNHQIHINPSDKWKTALGPRKARMSGLLTETIQHQREYIINSVVCKSNEPQKNQYKNVNREGKSQNKLLLSTKKQLVEINIFKNFLLVIKIAHFL